MTHFFTNLTPFPDVGVENNGRLKIELFLNALDEFVPIYDALGAAFYVAKRDIIKNISIIKSAYSRNTEKYTYIDDFVFHEKPSPSVISLLWLKRALEYTLTLFHGFYATIGDVEKGNPKLLAMTAYKKTLKRYHKGHTILIFRTIIKTAPSRASIIKSLIIEGNPTEEEMGLTMIEYLKPLEKNIEIIQEVLDRWNLDTPDKV